MHERVDEDRSLAPLDPLAVAGELPDDGQHEDQLPRDEDDPAERVGEDRPSREARDREQHPGDEGVRDEAVGGQLVWTMRTRPGDSHSMPGNG